MSEAACLFCKIVKKEIAAKIVFEDEATLCFHDISGKAPTHALVIPKVHYESLLTVPLSLATSLLGSVQRAAKETGVAETGFRTVINTGQDGGQSVLHLHFHVLGGRPLGWPPGLVGASRRSSSPRRSSSRSPAPRARPAPFPSRRPRPLRRRRA